jgi:hypothetical protein
LTRLLGQDSQAGPKGKNRQNKTGEMVFGQAETGQVELDGQKRKTEKGKQNKTGRQDCQDRTAGT